MQHYKRQLSMLIAIVVAVIAALLLFTSLDLGLATLGAYLLWVGAVAFVLFQTFRSSTWDKMRITQFLWRQFGVSLDLDTCGYTGALSTLPPGHVGWWRGDLSPMLAHSLLHSYPATDHDILVVCDKGGRRYSLSFNLSSGSADYCLDGTLDPSLLPALSY